MTTWSHDARMMPERYGIIEPKSHGEQLMIWHTYTYTTKLKMDTPLLSLKVQLSNEFKVLIKIC